MTALPMEGVRVLDIATFVAAPYCAAILGEFGAEVLKIEQPGTGDPMRHFGTPTARADATLAWLSEARNKTSITLDLRHSEGAALFRRLVAQADVVCENFRPGTLEAWGLGYEALAEINPGLVMLRVSGYGQTGPYKDRPGFARIAHAMGGLTYLAGMPGGPPVTPGSTSLGDYMSGMYGAIGVLMALRVRERTGLGQVIDIGLYESVFRVLDELAPVYGHTGAVREREGAGTVNAVPHGHFECKDGRWVAIACTSDKMFARLAVAMAAPDLVKRFGQQAARKAARDEVIARVAAWIGSIDRDGVMEKCLTFEVPCGAINSIADIFADPQYQARGNIETLEAEGVGAVPVPSVMPRLSATPGRINHLGPRLGNGNADVYRRLLGLSDAELERLAKAGVI